MPRVRATALLLTLTSVVSPLAMAASAHAAAPGVDGYRSHARLSSTRDHGWRADIGRYARRMIAAGFFPGMQVAVTRGSRVIYTGSFGLADIDSRRRVDDRTRFYIASTTKALTATAVMLEASRGSLQLDAPVTRYIPDLRFKAPLRADSVTLRRLLTMTDGIGACEPVGFRTAYSGVFTQAQLIGLMRDCGPARTGHTFVYRNLPYNILGIVLAPGRRDGWKAVVRRDVLKPLGMGETTARVSTLATARIAMPHKATARGFRRIRLAKSDANLHAAGGYFSTARDLARFVAVNAADGELDRHRIFPADVIASMHASHVAQDRDFGPYHRFGWGFGWDLGRVDGAIIVQRFGAFAGYRSHVSFMPRTGIGVVVLVNGVAVPYAVDEMADYIYDRLDGRFVQNRKQHAAAWLKLEQRKARYARYLRANDLKRHARQKPSLAHAMSAYAGRYANAQLGTMIWKVENGHLHVSIGIARSQAEIYDASKQQMRVELTGRGEVVSFQFGDGTGKASALRYDGYRFVRIGGGASKSLGSHPER
ncbi:serine hydrolase domain-containing protein [Oleiagrimonas sp. C23AA]|uniref:serine hydrolase domain-containing protein n=1 Tax=Oleiagrimonas sp. C23AA TaxID=2719047 RepID=UPI001420F86C|nr:serine hydrolase domain-containing protein [Oleiagrimonas sp. C23AA]NII09526.1 beta-lactamase family protein [Oleiagrimonas sp. C23AA]